MIYRMGLAKSYALVLHGTEAWTRASLTLRIAASGARFIIATTRFTAAEFARCNGCDYQNIYILPLGLKESSLPEEPAASSIGPVFKVLTVGRFSAGERYKGADTLIRVMAVAKQTEIAMSLTIVGGGDDLPRLRELSRALGVNDRVTFLNSVSEQQLQERYRDCDVFAMPSRSEGFGIVFLEAMRWGKPCIGGNHGGTPEVITDGHDGFLVEFGDVNTTFDRLSQLASNPDLRRQMGANARRTVASRFLFPHLRQRWWTFVDSALSLRAVPSRHEGAA
jgi:glycosyltransferase involved in cell wall biosynthesis